MDSSSSEEFTSDEEIEDIIESAWNKTKKCLDESNFDAKNVADEPKSDSENDSDGNTFDSPCFVLDKKPSSSKSDLIGFSLKEDSNSEKEDGESEKNDDSVQKGGDSGGDSENEDVGDDNASLFVVDKQPSLLNKSKSSEETQRKNMSDKKSETKEKKAQRRKDKRLSRNVELSSSLKVNWDPSNIYITLHSKHSPKPKMGTPRDRVNKEAEEVMKKSVVTPDFEKKDAVPSQEESRRQRQLERKKEREKSKGKGWFNLPKGEMTEETKNDLMALKMRRALDPKRFYKGDDIKGLPKYFQFGTVVEDAAEFYSARIPKKMRKKSMVDELMADAEFRKFNKRKYAEIQDMKSKGLGPYQGVRTMKIKKKKKK